jgi:cellobiose phosphorylase
MKEYTVHRVLGDAEFDITVKNPEGRESGVQRIVLDGKAIGHTVIPATPGKHIVEVIM